MTGKIVLVSEDKDFFDYFKPKLSLRKDDEVYTFSFDAAQNNYKYLQGAVFIVNSEECKEKTIDFIKVFSNSPIIVSSYNDEQSFKKRCFKAGMMDYITVMESDEEINTKVSVAQKYAGLLNKNYYYQRILRLNGLMSESNEVFLNYEEVLDDKLNELEKTRAKAVFIAISPDNNQKFLSKPEIIESIILGNIRQSDILMSYAPSKYFLLMFNINIKQAIKIWEIIKGKLPVKVYAGFSAITNQKRQALVNEVLNKLHVAINFDKDVVDEEQNSVEKDKFTNEFSNEITNFKMFKKDFEKRFEEYITPIFYRITVKYSNILSGATITQDSGKGYYALNINCNSTAFCFKITYPGYSKFNIDISYFKNSENIDSKRISLEPDEMNGNLIEDLVDQFITEYKKDYVNDNY